MRAQAFVLLAVHLNLIAAGLIRNTRFSSRSRLSRRHDDHPSFANTTSSDYDDYSSEYSITSTVALKAAQTPAPDGQIQSTAPAKGQFGSVPAFGSGPGAATTEEAKSQTVTTKVNSYPTSAPSAKDYHDESCDESIAAGPSSNNALTAKQSAIQSQSAPSKTPYAVATASAEASATGAASQQTVPASTDDLKGKNGNIAMAVAFNSVFATKNAQSSCNANNKDEVVACIKGQFAQCTNGKYTMIQCPQGQSCYALPLTGSTQGITVQCATKQDANQRLGQKSNPAPVSSSQPSASPVSQQPSAAKSSISSVASVAPSSSARSAQSYQSMSANHTQAPSAANSTASASGVIQSLAPGSTSIGQQASTTQSSSSITTSISSQPAASSKESTTSQSKPSAASTTTKETQSPTTSQSSPSATSTPPTTTPSPTVSSTSSTKPSAASSADDGQITVIPIP